MMARGGLHVEVVIAFQGRAYDLQARGQGEQLLIHLVGHEHHDGVRLSYALLKLFRGDALIGRVQVESAVFFQVFHDFRVNPAGNETAGFCIHETFLRILEPRPSTSVTMTRMTSRMADTS